MCGNKQYRAKIFSLCLLFMASTSVNAMANGQTSEAANIELVQHAFDAWHEGAGSIFDLLSDDVVWTVAGSSPVSGSYRTRQKFMENAVQPIHQRLASAITPDIKWIVAQGDHLVVIWDGSAQTQEGSHYVNSYAWHMVFKEGKVTQVTAFLDTWALNKLME